MQTMVFSQPADFKFSTSSWLDTESVFSLNVDNEEDFNINYTDSPISYSSSNTASPETMMSSPDSPLSPYSPSTSPDGSAPLESLPYYDQQMLTEFEVDAGTIDPLLLPEIEKLLNQPLPFFEDTPAPRTTSTKKRSREENSSIPAEMLSSDVLLPRDQLLNMTSKEIEEYTNSLKSKRTLSASEEKDLKRQRRLIKNREYAAQSRSRRKQYVDEIEAQLNTSKDENAGLKQQIRMLQEENKVLKKQLEGIANAVKKSQHGRNSNMTSSTGSMSHFAIGRSNNSVAKAGACLLVVMFMVFTCSTFWDMKDPSHPFAYKATHVPGSRARNILDSEDIFSNKYAGLQETYATPPSIKTNTHTQPFGSHANLLSPFCGWTDVSKNNTCSQWDRPLLDMKVRA